MPGLPRHLHMHMNMRIAPDDRRNGSGSPPPSGLGSHRLTPRLGNADSNAPAPPARGAVLALTTPSKGFAPGSDNPRRHTREP